MERGAADAKTADKAVTSDVAIRHRVSSLADAYVSLSLRTADSIRQPSKRIKI